MSTTNPSTLSPHEVVPIGERLLAGLAAALRRGVEATAFWSAVAMPLLYLPLVVGGFQGQETVAFLALLTANVLALLVGHDYRRERRETSSQD